jgi:hypothetical protein
MGSETMRVLDPPIQPPADLVRAAQARLLARLATPEPTGGGGRPADAAEAERYEFGEPFAAGGLGVIRRAYDRRLGRVVAVKELRRGDPDAERRFLLEAAITARLQHPAIVPLHDIGRFPTGEPYYCMKLVEGRSLEHVIRGELSARERLASLAHVLAVADAIAYAHRHGVIHRDLKPANILVGDHGETVVIDWGLAKDTTGRLAADLLGASIDPAEPMGETLTELGAIVGTLRYMPPEQARGEPVDARCDVFALGAVLFHVIAGRPPHATLDRAALLERLIADKVDDLRSVAPDAPRELAAIVQRAMSPRPDDRYPTAEAFADDLRRFLTGRLVDAHRYQPGELLRLWLRRHRTAAASAAAALTALLVSSLVFIANLRSERDRAAAARRDAEAQRQEAVRRADEALLAQARATLADDLDAALQLLGEVDLSETANLRRARLIALEAAARGAPDFVLRGHARAIEQLAPLSDGALLSLDGAGEVWRWDVDGRRGEPVMQLAATRGLLVSAAEAPVWAALAENRGFIIRGDDPPEEIDLGRLLVGEFAPPYHEYRWELSRHGETLAALSTGTRMRPRRFAAAYAWDLIARPARAHAVPYERMWGTALAPDGAAIALTTPERQVALITGDEVTPLPELRSALRFSPSGRYLLAVAEAGRVVAWSVRDGSVRTISDSAQPRGVVLAVTLDDFVLVHESDPDVQPLAHQMRLALRSLATGETRWATAVDDSRELLRAFSDGAFALAAQGDRFALHLEGQWQIRSMATGELEHVLDAGPHRQGAFLTDGAFAAAHHADVWIWELPRPGPRRLARALAPDGSHAVVATPDGRELALLRLADEREVAVECLAGLTARAIYDHSKGRIVVDRRGRVLFIGERGEACLSDASSGARHLAVSERATVAALAEHHEAFAVGLADGSILVWDAPDSTPTRRPLDAPPARLWLGPDGSVAVAQTLSGSVYALRRGADAPTRLGSARADEPQRGLRVAAHPRQGVIALALPDEETLALYDARSGEIDRRPVLFPPHPALAYSPSGARLAVAVAGRRLLVLCGAADPGHELSLPEEAQAVAFVDEDDLAVVGALGTVLRVDLELGEFAVLRRGWTERRERVGSLAASPTGELRMHAGPYLRVHPADQVPRAPPALRAWLTARAP